MLLPPRLCVLHHCRRRRERERGEQVMVVRRGGKNGFIAAASVLQRETAFLRPEEENERCNREVDTSDEI